MTQPGCKSALILLVSRIKQSANAAGLSTVRDMALASGVSKSGVDKIYRLRSYPCFDTLLAMANACGATVHEWTQGLEQDADSKGQRPEKGNPQWPEQPAKDAPKDAPKPEPAKPAPTKEDAPKDTGKLDLMRLLEGMKP